MAIEISVPISVGELVDKITILEIKAERIADPGKRANVDHELTLLSGVLAAGVASSPELTALTGDLRRINLSLWVIEDDIRDCEREADFGPRFIELARAVYVTNDERAAVKKKINLLVGSALVEEKSYADYRAASPAPAPKVGA